MAQSKQKKPCVVLVHGYMENAQIWSKILPSLSAKYELLNLDLPGHGSKEHIHPCNSVAQMGEQIIADISHFTSEPVYLVGHSLGGYVALSVLQQAPELLSGLCLFHSHPFADEPRRASDRKREISLIQRGYKERIVAWGIPASFYEGHEIAMLPNINVAKSIASSIPEETLIASLEAMRRRPDNSDLVRNTTVPIQFILGRHDVNINPQQIVSTFGNYPKVFAEILENSAHMGFIEETEASATILSDFINRIH
jgi:pimeloyl-ACP methyl ester carboxylesterase